MAENLSEKADVIIQYMQVWFEKQNYYSGLEKKAWNSAILAAAEFVRRMENYDEALCIEMMKLLINNQTDK